MNLQPNKDSGGKQLNAGSRYFLLLPALSLSLLIHYAGFCTLSPASQNYLAGQPSVRLDILLPGAHKIHKDTMLVSSEVHGEQRSASPQGNRYRAPEAVSPPPLALPAGPVFYHAKELDRRPEIISSIPPDPESLRTDLLGGTAVLEIWILESGLVARVIALNSNLSSDTLNGLSEIFRQARFSPGMIANTPVNSVLTIEVTINRQQAPDGIRPAI